MRLKFSLLFMHVEKKDNRERGFVKHLSYTIGEDKVTLLNSKSYLLLEIPTDY